MPAPLCNLLPNYSPIGQLDLGDGLVRGSLPPPSREACECLMMIGLPGAGKTYWAEQYTRQHPEKRYNILGTNSLIDRMKVMGLPRKHNYHGRWDVLISKCTECFNEILRLAARRRRNYVLDQTNVFPTARERKMADFQGFVCKAIVVVPTDVEFRRRVEQRERMEGKEIPDNAVFNMKANFVLPDIEETFLSEVLYTELGPNEAAQVVAQYNKDAAEKGVQMTRGVKNFVKSNTIKRNQLGVFDVIGKLLKEEEMPTLVSAVGKKAQVCTQPTSIQQNQVIKQEASGPPRRFNDASMQEQPSTNVDKVNSAAFASDSKIKNLMALASGQEFPAGNRDQQDAGSNNRGRDRDRDRMRNRSRSRDKKRSRDRSSRRSRSRDRKRSKERSRDNRRGGGGRRGDRSRSRSESRDRGRGTDNVREIRLVNWGSGTRGKSSGPSPWMTTPTNMTTTTTTNNFGNIPFGQQGKSPSHSLASSQGSEREMPPYSFGSSFSQQGGFGRDNRGRGGFDRGRGWRGGVARERSAGNQPSHISGDSPGLLEPEPSLASSAFGGIGENQGFGRGESTNSFIGQHNHPPRDPAGNSQSETNDNTQQMLWNREGEENFHQNIGRGGSNPRGRGIHQRRGGRGAPSQGGGGEGGRMVPGHYGNSAQDKTYKRREIPHFAGGEGMDPQDEAWVASQQDDSWVDHQDSTRGGRGGRGGWGTDRGFFGRGEDHHHNVELGQQLDNSEYSSLSPRGRVSRGSWQQANASGRGGRGGGAQFDNRRQGHSLQEQDSKQQQLQEQQHYFQQIERGGRGFRGNFSRGRGRGGSGFMQQQEGFAQRQTSGNVSPFLHDNSQPQHGFGPAECPPNPPSGFLDAFQGQPPPMRAGFQGQGHEGVDHMGDGNFEMQRKQQQPAPPVLPPSQAQMLKKSNYVTQQPQLPQQQYQQQSEKNNQQTQGPSPNMSVYGKGQQVFPPQSQQHQQVPSYWQQQHQTGGPNLQQQQHQTGGPNLQQQHHQTGGPNLQQQQHQTGGPNLQQQQHQTGGPNLQQQQHQTGGPSLQQHYQTGGSNLQQQHQTGGPKLQHQPNQHAQTYGHQQRHKFSPRQSMPQPFPPQQQQSNYSTPEMSWQPRESEYANPVTPAVAPSSSSSSSSSFSQAGPSSTSASSSSVQLGSTPDYTELLKYLQFYQKKMSNSGGGGGDG